MDRKDYSRTYNPNTPLTERLKEGVRWAALGLQNKQIGTMMGVTESTVKNLLSGAYQKLGVNDRAQAVYVASKQGWLEDPSWIASRIEICPNCSRAYCTRCSGSCPWCFAGGQNVEEAHKETV